MSLVVGEVDDRGFLPPPRKRIIHIELDPNHPGISRAQHFSFVATAAKTRFDCSLAPDRVHLRHWQLLDQVLTTVPGHTYTVTPPSVNANCAVQSIADGHTSVPVGFPRSGQ